jgi:hypothetical protein
MNTDARNQPRWSNFLVGSANPVFRVRNMRALLNLRLIRSHGAWPTFMRYTCSALLMLFFCTTTLMSADVKPYPLATCIVSGDKIDPQIQVVVHNNQQVRFCCKACIKKFQANPDKYMVRLQGADAGNGAAGK